MAHPSNRTVFRTPASSVALRALAAVLLASLLLSDASGAEGREPDRYGMTVGVGNAMDPVRDIRFALVSAFGLFDYGKLWGGDRPKGLCYKVEGAVGGTFHPDLRAIASLGAAVLYYVPRIAGPTFRPYAEAGIGVIYTDFQVRDQGLRINFNPQLGFGTEVATKDHGTLFTALRMHHLSNAGLHHDNRGVNSLILQVGRYF